MQTFAYPATIKLIAPDDFEVRFAELPEVITGASTEEAAWIEAEDALEVAAEHYIELGRSLPAPRPAKRGERLVPLAPAVAARAALAQAMRDQRLSKVALADKLDKDEKIVRRILSGKGASLDLTLEALRAVGVHPALALA